MGGEENKEKLLLGITYKKTLPCVPESQVPVMTWKSFAPICPQPPIARQNPHQKSECPDGEGSTLQHYVLP
jgi:hypothetical protein